MLSGSDARPCSTCGPTGRHAPATLMLWRKDLNHAVEDEDDAEEAA
jgi:hypothetical protein